MSAMDEENCQHEEKSQDRYCITCNFKDLCINCERTHGKHEVLLEEKAAKNMEERLQYWKSMAHQNLKRQEIDEDFSETSYKGKCIKYDKQQDNSNTGESFFSKENITNIYRPSAYVDNISGEIVYQRTNKEQDFTRQKRVVDNITEILKLKDKKDFISQGKQFLSMNLVTTEEGLVVNSRSSPSPERGQIDTDVSYLLSLETTPGGSITLISRFQHTYKHAISRILACDSKGCLVFCDIESSFTHYDQDGTIVAKKDILKRKVPYRSDFEEEYIPVIVTGAIVVGQRLIVFDGKDLLFCDWKSKDYLLHWFYMFDNCRRSPICTTYDGNILLCDGRSGKVLVSEVNFYRKTLRSSPDLFTSVYKICRSRYGEVVAVVNKMPFSKHQSNLVILDSNLQLLRQYVGHGKVIPSSAKSYVPTPEAFNITDVCFDLQDKMLIAESYSKSVQLLDHECQLLRVLILDIELPECLAIDGDGAAWISYQGGNVKVVRYSE